MSLLLYFQWYPWKTSCAKPVVVLYGEGGGFIRVSTVVGLGQQGAGGGGVQNIKFILLLNVWCISLRSTYVLEFKAALVQNTQYK